MTRPVYHPNNTLRRVQIMKLRDKQFSPFLSLWSSYSLQYLTWIYCAFFSRSAYMVCRFCLPVRMIQPDNHWVTMATICCVGYHVSLRCLVFLGYHGYLGYTGYNWLPLYCTMGTLITTVTMVTVFNLVTPITTITLVCHGYIWKLSCHIWLCYHCYHVYLAYHCYFGSPSVV